MYTQADFALSTMWNYSKADSGEALMDQILSLGFSSAELNYQVKAEWLPAIEQYIKEGRVRVSSVHNVFPKIYDERFDTDSVLLGYEDSALRKQSIELGKRSINWACRLGAKAVVFHPAEIPLDRERYDHPLKMMLAEGRGNTPEFHELQAELLEARRTEPYLDRMCQSIEELADYVVSHHLPVKLGMENRSMAHQIPVFSEFDLIAERFGGGPVGIWLDTGHAIMMRELGLQHLPLSKAAARSIVGMHIHDAVNGRDHYAPYSLQGDVLDPFMPYIIKSPIKVLELSGRLSPDEIKEGVKRIVTRTNEWALQEDQGPDPSLS